ncbi:MAG: hypothetical protein CMP59_05190 [Flavobacteriales bacterium]|nr:hypothetical protein [Flavobacteriales bacterium]|tara:strand:+ start:2480 stop:3751 length:1272 start_codon:yes stop_codon:yes gene_type:complete
MKSFLFALCSIALLSLNAQHIIHVPRDAANLSSAVQLANSGDTIIFASGIFTDSAHVNNKRLVIQGQADGSSVLSPGINGRSFELLNSDVEFIHLTFDNLQQNTPAPNYAISATYSDVKIYQCSFNNLLSPVYLYWGHLAISHSTFSEVRGSTALQLAGGSFNIHNNLFYGQNYSAAMINRANGSFYNNTLIGATTSRNYGIIINVDSITHIYNNIIDGFARGIYLLATDSSEFNALRIHHNNIYNVAHLYRYEYNESLNRPIFYGNLTPNPGIGEISVYSNFMDTLNKDYSLQSNSPCIDAGTNAYPNSIGIDLNGNNRLVGLQTDLGAFEYSVLTGLDRTHHDLEAKIEVFPQPTNNHIYLRFKEKRLGRIEILDTSGEVANQITLTGQNELRIELPETKGLYFLRLINDESVIVKKIIKI